MDLTTATQ